MPLNKKYFIYYSCVSVKQGLNIESNTSELMLDKSNKEVYERCRYCCCVTEIKKDLTENSFVCDACFKLLQNQYRIIPQVYIIWTENQKCRVFTNFHRSFLDNIFRMENIKSKCGEILQETIEIYVQSST